MRKRSLSGWMVFCVVAAFLIPLLAMGTEGKAVAAPGRERAAAVAGASSTDAVVDDTSTDTVPAGIQPPKGGTGWVYAGNTDEYYYFLNGRMLKDYWLPGTASQWNLWYYMDRNGKLATGFRYIQNPGGTGWFLFQKGDENGCRGQMLAGWQDTGMAGRGWFTTSHGGHYGECTYTAMWGNYDAASGFWSDGLTHR